MKIKQIKKVFLAVLITLFFGCAMGLATLATVKAESKQIIVAGASARIAYSEEDPEVQKKNGLRFSIYLKNVAKEEIESSYALVIPNDLLDGTSELTEATSGVKKEVTTDKWYTYTDEVYGDVLCSHVVLYNIDTASYNRNITVGAVVNLTDGTILKTDYRAEDYKGTRSLAFVAQKAIESGEYTEDEYVTGILNGYNAAPAPEGTYVQFESVTLGKDNATGEAVSATPAYWSNYYKGYNVLSFNVTVEGDVADVSSLKYVLNDGTALALPLGALVPGEAKQVPVDFNYAANSQKFSGGHFEATISNDTTVTISPMPASTVTTESLERYDWSREDHDLRLNFINGIESADQVLSVKYNGSLIDFALDTAKNRIVLSNTILSDSATGKGNGATSEYFEITTATKKYLIQVRVNDKAMYEADDLFYQASNGNWYSWFDITWADRVADVSLGSYDFIKTNSQGSQNSALVRVAADIDVSGDTRVAKVNSYISSENNPSTYATAIVGFRGELRGEGHTITGLTVGSKGIFGHIGGSLIQDIAFKDVKFQENADYSYVLAYMIASDNSGGRTVRIKNVFISIASGQYCYFDNAQSTTSNCTNSGMLALHLTDYITMENVVIDFSKLGTINEVTRSVFWGKTNVSAFSNAKNLYVISTTALGTKYCGDNSQRYVEIFDAKNKSDVNWYGKKFAWLYGYALNSQGKGDWRTVEVIEGLSTVAFSSNASLYRFDNVEEAKTYIAENNVDLSAFGSCWDTATGYPVWKTA